MAFLALASQKSLMMLQKNFLQFQYTSIMNQTQAATAQMTAIENEISGLKTLVQNNIKSSCTLNLINS